MRVNKLTKTMSTTTSESDNVIKVEKEVQHFIENIFSLYLISNRVYYDW